MMRIDFINNDVLNFWYDCKLLPQTTISLPFGMAVAGSFKSPDRFAPATIPVTAGKNTPNTLKKLGVLSGSL